MLSLSLLAAAGGTSGALTGFDPPHCGAVGTVGHQLLDNVWCTLTASLVLSSDCVLSIDEEGWSALSSWMYEADVVPR